MDFLEPLIEGRFLKRYKRFFADVELTTLEFNGEVVVAHVANTGSLKGVAIEGQKCLCSRSSDPKRKLKYSLEAIAALDHLRGESIDKNLGQFSGANGANSAASKDLNWIGVNTSFPNKLIHEALKNGLLSHWQKFVKVKPEHAISKETRFDFAAVTSANGKLDANDKFNYFIEVKNVSLVENEVAKFPDSVTERGQKHLRELIKLKEEGHDCEIVFVVQRTDCKTFSAAADIDPEYAILLQKAKEKGVRITPLVFEVKPQGIHFVRETAFNS